MRFLLTLALAFGALTTMATADEHEPEFTKRSMAKQKPEDYEEMWFVVMASQCGLTRQYAT